METGGRHHVPGTRDGAVARRQRAGSGPSDDAVRTPAARQAGAPARVVATATPLGPSARLRRPRRPPRLAPDLRRLLTARTPSHASSVTFYRSRRPPRPVARPPHERQPVVLGS